MAIGGDWSLPVPEGTRVVEYSPVSNEERAAHVIELETELIGEVAQRLGRV